jgi:regulator of RNase E activity RraA
MTDAQPSRPFTTADLCDGHGARLQIAQPIFRSHGGRPGFAGRIHTVQVFKDNVLVISPVPLV